MVFSLALRHLNWGINLWISHLVERHFDFQVLVDVMIVPIETTVGELHLVSVANLVSTHGQNDKATER